MARYPVSSSDEGSIGWDAARLTEKSLHAFLLNYGGDNNYDSISTVTLCDDSWSCNSCRFLKKKCHLSISANNNDFGEILINVAYMIYWCIAIASKKQNKVMIIINSN